MFETLDYETVPRLKSPSIPPVPIQNANAYFNAIKTPFIGGSYRKQIRITKQEIRYFSLIDSQIQYASPVVLDEIAAEWLIEALSEKGLPAKIEAPAL